MTYNLRCLLIVFKLHSMFSCVDTFSCYRTVAFQKSPNLISLHSYNNKTVMMKVKIKYLHRKEFRDPFLHSM